MNTVKHIAVFASGTGSNAERIIEHFKADDDIKVSLIVTNKKDAGVVSVAERNKLHVLHIDKEKFFRGNGYVDELKAASIDFVVLAGFLWKIPQVLIDNYRNRIINIHPALLPKYGGKGMYGQRVHEAILANKEKETGITIHYVDENYDNGDVIFQATCPVYENDTPAALARRVHQLEHEHFPKVVEECVKKL